MEYCLNDTELYKAVLEEFVNDSGEKEKELEEFFGKADWENYIIRIHSIKSSARMIGAISIIMPRASSMMLSSRMTMIGLSDTPVISCAAFSGT